MTRPARTVLRRTVATGGVLATVAGAFVLGTTHGDGASPGKGQDGGTDGTIRISYAGSGLAPAADCAELQEWYVERGLDRVTAWGWEQPIIYTGVGLPQAVDDVGSPVSGTVEEAAAGPAPAAVPGTARSVRQSNEETGTNVQEAGVDEPDVVKTDGGTLFRVEGDDLVTYDVTGSEVRRLGEADLPRMGETEVLLAGSTVVAIGQLPQRFPVGPRSRVWFPTPTEGSDTRVVVLDVSDPASPEVVQEATYDSSLVTARLHGDVVRLVVQAGLPDLPFVQPRPGRSHEEALRHNRQVVRSSTADDWLPSVTVDGGDAAAVMDCEDVAIPEEGDTLGTIAVVGFDPADPGTREATGIAADTDLAYASTDQLYLATSANRWGMDCCWDPVLRDVPVDDGVSRLYAFDLEGLTTTFAASGEVDGSIRDRWSMDAVDGVLRVAVGPSSRTGNFSSVVTFRRDGTDLVEAGRLDKLGVDEEIRSVRWFDELAIVVTFRQIDPLYAVDLTDPGSPTLLGELKIPGFSSYLHPLGPDRMLGMGEGPAGRGGWGAQAGLFDVSDLSDVRRLDVHSYGHSTHANAGTDPRQLTWLPEERTVLTVVTKWGRSTTGYVSVLRLDGGHLENRMVEVDHGSETGLVRLVPLPDGRVVLATGDGVEFFEL